MMTGTQPPLRSLMFQMPFLLDAKSRGANSQLGSGDGGPLPGQSPAQHPFPAADTGSWGAARWGSRGPMAQYAEHIHFLQGPLPKAPFALSKHPPCHLLGLTLARQLRALWGGFSQRPIRPLGRCRKSWRPALQCTASGYQGVPGHRKEVPVALVLSKETGPGGPQECPGPRSGA